MYTKPTIIGAVEFSNRCTIINLYSTDYSQFIIMTVYQNSILEQSFIHTKGKDIQIQ